MYVTLTVCVCNLIKSDDPDLPLTFSHQINSYNLAFQISTIYLIHTKSGIAIMIMIHID